MNTQTRREIRFGLIALALSGFCLRWSLPYAARLTALILDPTAFLPHSLLLTYRAGRSS